MSTNPLALPSDLGVSVEISRAAHAAIVRHAAENQGAEVCGLLFGTSGRIDGVMAAANIAETPENRFEIDPKSLFSALRAERAGGPTLIGYYHSHPDGTVRPSSEDRKMAYETGRYWIIVSGKQLALWQVVAEACFKPVELALASG
jgi:proteasome lid subunit RPN8/RPN11